RLVIAESRETCPGRGNEKAAVLQYHGDGFGDVSGKEPNTENFARGSHRVNIRHPRFNIEWKAIVDSRFASHITLARNFVPHPTCSHDPMGRPTQVHFVRPAF